VDRRHRLVVEKGQARGAGDLHHRDCTGRVEGDVQDGQPVSDAELLAFGIVGLERAGQIPGLVDPRLHTLQVLVVRLGLRIGGAGCEGLRRRRADARTSDHGQGHDERDPSRDPV